ncbi:3-keto-disaccharide hydrolase [Paludisphaera mucosa]|uniref:DUF1080 domain-containing protein n=1 Tax=Paludisphaera mucosa TaxID=3030827 RepID=A0ABT6FKX6_9BACT|nr:DUF1080 domain-containing protein [Paludisphaera mucosa]MDG3008232.1 DUF1080 domain-containing protein [Paludisphaera mucosa]
MRYALASVAAFVALSLPASAQDRSHRLFNGRDLSGWKAISDKENADAAATWSVVDGVLKCTGEPAGYLKTDDEYSDYVLSLEWRWPKGSKGGNNGVLVHTSTPRALGVWPKSIEVQLYAGNAGDLWVIGTDLDVPDEASRKEDRRHKNLTDGSEKPIGEWNRMEITCEGSTMRVKVNGDLVNEATNCTVSRGAISLQSEGTPIEFRNIVITPLKP